MSATGKEDPMRIVPDASELVFCMEQQAFRQFETHVAII